MNDHDGSDDAARTTRIIIAERYRSDVLMGEVEIHAYTKHGSTSMISVMPPEKLHQGEVLKTRVWMLGAKQFIILGEHKKPMKIAGDWYEVRLVKSAV